MLPEHYNHIKDRIDAYCRDNEVSIESLKSQYADMGLSEKRLRWDLQYIAVETSWICKYLYQYLDDSHIDTALRKITQ